MAASPAERMRVLRTRRRARAEREIRITVPDARRGEVRARVRELNRALAFCLGLSD